MSPRQLVIQLLDRYERTDAYADLLLEHELSQSQLSKPDKSLAQEIFFGVIRWRKRLDWIATQFFLGDYAKAPHPIRYVLESAFYQLIFMDRIPAYAVIHEAVELAKLKGSDYWGKKTNAILRTFQRGQRPIHYPDVTTDPIKSIAVAHSHPEWMVGRWIDRFGMEETIALCKANNTSPRLSIRVNSLKTSADELQDLLLQNEIEATKSEYLENFLVAKQLPDLNNFQPFQHGLFSIQDVSAGLACKLLYPAPGEKIIDLCAAPGGKSTFLAELSGDRAEIIAVDVNQSRLNLVEQNVQRLGLKSIRLIQANGATFSCDPVDKVILDAPCSGLGVLAKRVDLRWKRTLAQIKEISRLQYELLTNAATLLKPGGILVYCTCTIEPEENENMIEQFLTKHQDFTIEPASKYGLSTVVNASGFVYTYPHRHGIDGSFAVRLIKE
ncbi:16S rRNA (cytosine(967)-C(5))-methyltransferase RsmB [candidate division KSB1 bacterium]|nr:16S rRNA (cytosine(967)-C(5))-methyltransferase RsmB [candidate division KSB1 bacterium]